MPGSYTGRLAQQQQDYHAALRDAGHPGALEHVSDGPAVSTADIAQRMIDQRVSPDEARGASTKEQNAYRNAQNQIDVVGDGSGQAPLARDPLSPFDRARMDRANQSGAEFTGRTAAELTGQACRQ